MEKYNLIAKTFSGLEPVLANEIKNIGGQNINQGRRAVFYEGDKELIYKSNYYLRTALRILKEIDSFQFKDVDHFYLKCKKINWEKYLNINQSFAISSTVIHSNDFRNSMFASLKVKDAIADYFRQKKGKRPNVDTQTPEVIINAHINKNICSLSIDSSGESLHKRGYRTKQGEAPLSEVLAAGMILLSGWNGQTDFIDPMCGSGTLPIEAAMIAQNIPAGRFRKNYAFMEWADYDELLFEKIKAEQNITPFSKQIFASDISRSNVLNAETNARRARVYANITFQTADIKDLEINCNNATIIINPPYGERLKQQNIDKLYSLLGERMKHQFAGNTAWVLTSSKEYLKNIGLKPAQKNTLFNGSLECSYVKYPLFKGKRIKK
ncbi:putative N6-adenine-specific DNA methylase [Tangfeifania diversioriginum]|uniref:Putative N6-adenine-specific DNA methylase n=1 Tax=Tangfeifania diversioriginum TaxID=1168035 RepID=A0A1M6BS21_9BACT|nr:class I SAM-dependent RNA methyltransferase [Tangfeifania diversioriginum]SHI51487.1 putative N6-adenine-specific DNA methylase [Tangfeifania diversioriginum]